MEKEQGFCEGKRLQDSKTRGRKIRKKDNLFRLLSFCSPLSPPSSSLVYEEAPPFLPGSRAPGGGACRAEAPFPAFSSSFLSLLLSPAEGLSLELAAEGGGQGSEREVSVSDEVKSSCPRSPRLLPAERGLAKSNPLLPASPRGRVFSPLRSRSLGEVSGRGQTSKKGKTFFSSIFLIFIFF